MAAFIGYSCSCTSACCNCPTQGATVSTVAVIGRHPILLMLDMGMPAIVPGIGEPPALNSRKLFGGDFLTWLFWTRWQIAPPMAVDSLPPARPRNATRLRKPRVRARGHHPGHSPRTRRAA